MYQFLLFSFLFVFVSCFNAKEIKHRPTEATASAQSISLKSPVAPKSSIFDLKMKNIDGEEISLTQYKGKKIVVLNVASKCGFTPQYADWEKFYEENKEKVVVLGFPCNQFLGQEPEDNAGIKSFCQKNYGVTFPIFEKIDVKGSAKAPLYTWLTDKTQNGWCDQEPSWNFCKYLINEQGELVEFFASKIKPDDEVFKAALK